MVHHLGEFLHGSSNDPFVVTPPGEYFYFIHVKHLKCMVEQHIATYISHADMVKNTSKYLHADFRLKHTAHFETDSGSGLADTGKSQ